MPFRRPTSSALFPRGRQLQDAKGSNHAGGLFRDRCEMVQTPFGLRPSSDPRHLNGAIESDSTRTLLITLLLFRHSLSTSLLPILDCFLGDFVADFLETFFASSLESSLKSYGYLLRSFFANFLADL